MRYDNDLKNARMKGMRAFLAGGSIELLSGDGGVLVTFRISKGGGEVEGDGVWTVGLEKHTVLAGAGNDTLATQARIKDMRGQVRVEDLTVGTANADVVLTSKRITQGQDVTIHSVMFVHAP